MTDESSQNVIALYEQYAADFDHLRERRLIEKSWLDKFAAMLPEKPLVLDIGCGSADPVARYLIESGHDVTGVDASGPLIDLCRIRFPQNQWLLADMRQLELARRFDGLIAWHSLFHLTPQDQRGMFARFQMHAAKGAALMFTAGPRDGEDIGLFHGQPLYHASLAFDDYEKLLAKNGFELVDYISQDENCGGATVYLAKQTTS